MSYKVQTVLGDVSPTALGVVLPHEHMSMEFETFYRRAPSLYAGRLAGAIQLGNAGLVRQWPYSCRDNLRLNDAAAQRAVIDDLHTYKLAGGGTIVENSTVGLERRLELVVAAARETALHVVAGTGLYVQDTLPDQWLHAQTEELYTHMRNELTQGCRDYPAVRAGFLGEVASVWPIRDIERRCIRATGELQAETGCGVSFHPARDPRAPAEILRIYLEAGGRADKAVMSHLDRTLLDEGALLEFASAGAVCQLDLFGVEVSYYQLSPVTSVDMPSDARRMDMVRALVADGHQDRVLISHDIHTKHRLTAFGGHGYAHILTSVVPRLRSRGMSKDTIELITVHNPARWLQLPADC